MKIPTTAIAAICAAAGIAAGAKTTTKSIDIPGGQATVTIVTAGDEEPSVNISTGGAGDVDIQAEIDRMEKEIDREFDNMNRRFGFGPGFGRRPGGPGFRHGFGGRGSFGRGFGGRPGNFRREQFTCPHCGAEISRASYSDRKVFKNGVEVKDEDGKEAKKPEGRRGRRDFRRGPAGKRGFGKGKPCDGKGPKPECRKGKPCDGKGPKPECRKGKPCDGKGPKPECRKGKPCDGKGPKPECGKGKRRMVIKKQDKPLPPPEAPEKED